MLCQIHKTILLLQREFGFLCNIFLVSLLYAAKVLFFVMKSEGFLLNEMLHRLYFSLSIYCAHILVLAFQ